MTSLKCCITYLASHYKVNVAYYFQDEAVVVKTVVVAGEVEEEEEEYRS